MSSAWALIEYEERFLFVKRSFHRGRGGQWCPPGGTIWRRESPEVACVREAFEETGLRVTVEQPLAVFDSAHYFLCSLNTTDYSIQLAEDECIDYAWTSTDHLLDVGTVMDLRRLIPVFKIAGHELPSVPPGLEAAVPDRVYDTEMDYAGAAE